MTLNEIFPDEGLFMGWLSENCYSCAKLQDDPREYNYECEFENTISYDDLDKELDDELVQLITKDKKPCKCRNFVPAPSKIQSS